MLRVFRNFSEWTELDAFTDNALDKRFGQANACMLLARTACAEGTTA